MEKIIIFCLLALSTVSQASTKENCNGNFEAKFIGKIDSVHYFPAEAGDYEHTTYGIGDFSFYQVNPLCPLDADLALSAQISVQGDASVESGQAVSGVIVYYPKIGRFSIEQ